MHQWTRLCGRFQFGLWVEAEVAGVIGGGAAG